MSEKRMYRVIFANQGQIYEVYARAASHSALIGFVEIEGLVFNAKSGVVIDPSEEKLKSEFEGVNKTFIPMHAIVRIDEVSKQGPAKIVPFDGKMQTVVSYPGTPLPSGNEPTRK